MWLLVAVPRMHSFRSVFKEHHIESIRLHCTYRMQHMTVHLCLKSPLWCLPIPYDFWGELFHSRKDSPILKRSSSRGKFAEDLLRIIVCHSCNLHLNPSCFDRYTNFERYLKIPLTSEVAGCFHINNILLLWGNKSNKYQCQVSSLNSPCIFPCSHQLTWVGAAWTTYTMPIWDKVKNHGNGSVASQTHMFEKHHWGSAFCKKNCLVYRRVDLVSV